MRFLTGILLGLAVGTMAMAENTPPPGKHDGRVRNASYVDGQVYRVAVGLMRVTSIEFPAGEEIKSIVAGDTEAFQFDGVPGGQALVVKPTIAGASTNMVVYTNRRAYYLYLQDQGAKAFYVVRFGGGVAAKAAGGQDKVVKPGAVWSRYAGNKLTEITPLQAWDDGTFTYFRFAKHAPIPAIFRTTRGPERVVNSTAMTDGTIRVSGVSPYWVLRSGSTETVVKRMNADE